MATHHIPTIDDIPFNREVITIPSSASIIEAFKVLVENKILSAPVVDVNSDTPKYFGFFGVSDFAKFVIETVSKEDELPMEFCDLRELLVAIQMVHPKTLEAVVNASGQNQFLPVPEGSPLQKVLDVLSQGVHRVPVINAEGKITKIVSQSAVAKYLHEHAPLPLKSLEERPIAEAGLGSGDVVTVNEDATALEALQKLQSSGFSGLAVVDSEGEILTTISISDLRAVVSGPQFRFKGITVLEFVQRSRAQDGSQEKPAVVTVQPDVTIHTVVSKLAKTGLHRVYVVKDRKPVGVISLKDIIRYILLETTK